VGIPPANPPHPLQTDAAEGGVFTGDRQQMGRWTPHWVELLRGPMSF